MANNVAYDIKFVSKSRETLERLVKIMKYQDPEYFIYRVFSVEDDPIEDEGDGLFSIYISGDVAWSNHDWFEHQEDFDCKAENGAHYVTLDILAKRLDFGVEAYCEECGCEFQEWHRTDHNGNTQDKCFALTHGIESRAPSWRTALDFFAEIARPLWQNGLWMPTVGREI